MSWMVLFAISSLLFRTFRSSAHRAAFGTRCSPIAALSLTALLVAAAVFIAALAPMAHGSDAASAATTSAGKAHVATFRGYDVACQLSRSSAAASEFVLAAKEGSRGARFVVDAAGETRVFVHGADGAMEVAQHAARRITQRGLTVDKVEGVVRGADPFRYFHAGKWKTGYYDPASRVFVGSADRRITTVINDAKPQYIQNLKAAQP